MPVLREKRGRDHDRRCPRALRRERGVRSAAGRAEHDLGRQSVQAHLPGGFAIAISVYLIFDFGVVTVLFAMIFRYLPDAKIRWRDVWVGAAITDLLFALGNGRWVSTSVAAQRLQLTARPARSSPCCSGFTIRRRSFSSERSFTQVYADHSGAKVVPDEHAVRIETQEVENPPETRGAARKSSAG